MTEIVAGRVDVPLRDVELHLVRQYGPQGGDFTELVTIGAVPWHRRREKFDTALCIASRMKVTSHENNDVYWLGLAQAWTETPADGQPRSFDGSVFSDASLSGTFAKLVPSARILSLARPLASLRTVDDVATALVEPLLKQPWSV